MVDPITLATGAVAGFNLLKKGFSAGKELHQMGSELNSVLDFISGAKEAKKSGSKSNPLNDYIQYQKAIEMEKALENLIFDCHGSKGVAKYKDFVSRANSAQRDSKYAAIARKNKILNVLSILLGVSITLGGGAALVWFAIEFKP